MRDTKNDVPGLQDVVHQIRELHKGPRDSFEWIISQRLEDFLAVRGITDNDDITDIRLKMIPPLAAMLWTDDDKDFNSEFMRWALQVRDGVNYILTEGKGCKCLECKKER